MARKVFRSRNFIEYALPWTIVPPHIQNLAAESREVMLQDACYIHCAISEIKMKISYTRLGPRTIREALAKGLV